VPIVFAIGQALVILVATHIGAGQAPRARRITWAGTLAAVSVCLAIGSTAALLPTLWVSLFSSDAGVHDAGSLYLRIVAPFYPFFGAGMALYFAAQGAGRVGLPILAGTARLVAVAAGGLLVVWSGAPLYWLFAVVACGMMLFGGIAAAGVHRTRW
jgi:Na+-driven multidrug efflux pump